MRILFVSTLMNILLISDAQTRNFEFLSASKTSIEQIIKSFGTSISDTSDVYKRFYLPLSQQYIKAKAAYDGYRGAMKDCVLAYNSKKKIQKCLRANLGNIKSDLDSLNSILTLAYWEAYKTNSLKDLGPSYNGKNAGLLDGDFVKNLLDNLISGALKLWDQSKKYQKEYKDNYITNISSKDYDLADLKQLLKG